MTSLDLAIAAALVIALVLVVRAIARSGPEDRETVGRDFGWRRWR